MMDSQHLARSLPRNSRLHPPASPGHYTTTRAKSPERARAAKGAAQQSAEYLNPLGWTPLVVLPIDLVDAGIPQMR